LLRECPLGLSEILERDHQHAEALTVLLTQVFVMHLVRLANGQEIWIGGLPKPLDALMNEDLMHEEVQQPIDKNAKTDPQPWGV